MKKFLFSSKGQGGVALIAVVLTVALVLALFVMAFTNAIIGQVVTESHLQTRISAQCGYEAIAITNELLIDIARDGILALDVDRLPSGVKMGDNTQLAKTDLNDEIRGNTALATDTANIIITKGTCTTSVDIDFLSDSLGAGEAEIYLTAYHAPIGGTACGGGAIYSITAVTKKAGGVSTTANSAFFKCQG